VDFDLLIQGGELVDPATGTRGRFDVAVRDGRVAAVERSLAHVAAAEVVDATGMYVTPGLVDLHTHVYPGVTYWGIWPDPIAAQTGVTTWIDAGSAGAYTVSGLHDFVVEQSAVGIYAFLNIATIGLVHPTHELALLEYCDVELCQRMAEAYPDFVRGIKVRMGVDTVGPHGLEPLARARQAADALGLPLMAHLYISPPNVSAVLDLLRPGDIVTHCLIGSDMRLADVAGHLLDATRRAVDRGVRMDVGHGVGSFSFEAAESALADGLPIDFVSSDMHLLSRLGPMFDLPTCMSKMLVLGLSLDETIAAATTRPAELLGLAGEIGTLRPGARGDLAVFRLLEGRFPLYDTFGQVRYSSAMLRNVLTVRNGRVLPDLIEQDPPPWITPSPEQRRILDMGHVPDRLAPVTRLVPLA
jgi:dihydroorotase